ncbi:flagellar filament capping protein FliD [Pseudalkalibacillus caeni]|uniref:Flagellar hook-associated protein 2 n=1 Tax=Exobacillus caeni TaxID=2574798 RepID=A0A5R9FAG3_9BACL|nr:flagellar filament capping protein FliD [Pseudalkalibacillus caeni]TLS36615.1 flagellar cap protein [Pseudalkalibacillus caeni]
MRITGMASGMDIDQMVKDLMKAERIPMDKLFQKKQTFEWQKQDYRDINLSLSSIRSMASELRFSSAFISYSTNSTNETAVKASPTSNTSPGTHSVDVVSLAKTAKLNSGSAIQNLSGTNAKSTDKVLAAGTTETFTVTNGGGLTSTVTLDDTDTYGSLATKIAGAVDDSTGESLGLRANFDSTTSRFFFSTKEMGADKSITFQNTTFVQNQVLAGSANTASGTDGAITFDGIQVTGLKQNTTTVNGIKLDLLQEGQSATITVQSDVSMPFDKIKAFVEKYNETIEAAEKELLEKRYRDFPPLTDEQKESMSEKEIELWEEKAKSGMLNNDPVVRGILTDLRRAWLDPVQGIPTGELNMLSQIGINTGDYREGGKLFIDEKKLKDALQNKPDEVMNLFTKGSEGIGERLYSSINESIDKLGKKAGTPGTSLVDNSVLSKRIKDIDERMRDWEDRLTRIEDRYWRQFTALETAMNRMNQQGMWIQQNLFGGM